MPHDEIPDMLGRVLSGSKYQLKQARGRFGLGAKMALIWSKMTTARPLQIHSAQRGQKFISVTRLDIDIHKNEPKILQHEKKPNDGRLDRRFPAQWHGTEISVDIEGQWIGVGQSFKWKILRYMRRLAVITPYAEFFFHFEDPSRVKDVLAIRYARRTEVIPPPPKEVKHHPSSVDLVVVEELLRRAEHRKQTLLAFLTGSFSEITSKVARQLIEALGDKFSADMLVTTLDKPMLKHVVKHLTTEHEWPPPSAEALSPAGAYNLYLGIMKEVHPEMIVTHQEKPHVYQGHAFIVEAAVSLGGKTVNAGLNIFRFANRIPLLFEQASDVITRTANEIKFVQPFIRSHFLMEHLYFLQP